MKISIAQTRPIKGDLAGNILSHKKFIRVAAGYGAHLIVFPELSLTGYEPTLAEQLASDPSDPMFIDFQTLSNENKIVIGAGLPTRSARGVHISLVLFRPHEPVLIYSKKHLHPDEEEFFASGSNFPVFDIDDVNISFAICYEISIDDHICEAADHGAHVYVASVAKFESGIQKAVDRLGRIATEYRIPVLMSNCIGECDGQWCAGGTSAWNDKGVLLDQLGAEEQGMVLFTTESMTSTKIVL
jgi:predicted amidohydrolase